jgi:orotidine-5'-phosphate decarboxylase
MIRVRESAEFERPEHRIFLTVDFDSNAYGGFSNLRFLAADFNHKILAVKLGQGFLLHERSYAMQNHLQATGTTTYLDAKYREDPDQMGYVIAKSAENGYKYVSVAPSAGRAALIAAGLVQPNIQVVNSLSSGDKELNEIEISNITQANLELDAEHRLGVVMCNVADIEHVKELGDFTVIATGIRMRGDPSHDQHTVMEPAEALLRGADYLAVGRAVTRHTRQQDRAEAFDRILENIASVQ